MDDWNWLAQLADISYLLYYKSQYCFQTDNIKL